MEARNRRARAPWRGVLFLLAACGLGVERTSLANAVTDWDARAAALATVGAQGEREGAIVHLAAFEAVNSIAHRYRPYVADLPFDQPVSAEAAAATAACKALAALHPADADALEAELAKYLQLLDGDAVAVANGARLGEAAAGQILAARAGDGTTSPDSYRPVTRPGQYVPTSPVIAASWPDAHPFVLERPAQFRPGPPPSLAGGEWATDYNEIKGLGRNAGSHRTPAQTETARFWLMTGMPAYHPIARQVVADLHLDLLDSARFMALYSMALTDAFIAVFDAKYHYQFWRPVTAIRNGDQDGNPATARDPAWQPIDATPMHPEYPCAHCIAAGAARAVIRALAGPRALPELALTSATAPGVTHRWNSLDALVEEVSDARIWAGFHYRFSTRVGTGMGQQVGDYVVAHALQARQP